jgi:hypothetical protein
MRKIVMFASMLALAVAAVAPLAVAQDDAAKGVAVTLKGINYNLVEALAKGTTATAEVNALKVSEATGADGAAIDALKGKTVHYLATEAAKALASGKDNANKTVTVKGTLFADANAILVESFEAEGGDEWDELDVNSLSGQQVL